MIQIRTVFRSVQDCNFLWLQELSNNFGTTTSSNILHKNCTIMDGHVLQLIYITMIIHGHFFWQKKQSSRSICWHCPKIMTLGEYFILDIVYPSSNRFPVVQRTKRLRVVNCCTVDLSVNNTFYHCWTVHFVCFCSNVKRLSFIACINLGLRAGLWAFKPNSSTKRRFMVLRLISAPFESSSDQILLAELIGDWTAILWIKWLSLGVVFRSLPDFLEPK